MHHVALKFIDAVERFGSIRAAARHLNVASSSITRQIQNLEHGFGVQLFERSTDGVVPTNAGEIVLTHIKNTLRDLERTKTQVAAISGRRDTIIHIVTVDSVASSFLPILLSEYLSEHPGVRFKVSVFTSSRVWDQMATAEADVGFNFLPIEAQNVRERVAFQLELGVACARDHPIAAHVIVSLREALTYPVVASSIAAPIFDEVREVSEAVSGDTNAWIETDSTSMAKNLIETGRFISIRTILFSVGYDLSSLRTVWRPVDQTLPIETLVIGTPSDTPSEGAVSDFVDYARCFLEKSLS